MEVVYEMRPLYPGLQVQGTPLENAGHDEDDEQEREGVGFDHVPSARQNEARGFPDVIWPYGQE